MSEGGEDPTTRATRREGERKYLLFISVATGSHAVALGLFDLGCVCGLGRRLVGEVNGLVFLLLDLGLLALAVLFVLFNLGLFLLVLAVLLGRLLGGL